MTYITVQTLEHFRLYIYFIYLVITCSYSTNLFSFSNTCNWVMPIKVFNNNNVN